jgi:hypothetical protein
MLVDFDFAKTIKNINDGKSGKLVNDRSPSTSSDAEVRVPDINTEPATTKSDMNPIWTVSGLVIHAYKHAINAAIFSGNPTLCCSRCFDPLYKMLCP